MSRVPLTIKAATELVKSVDSNQLTVSQIQGYDYRESRKTYAAVEQRWLLVESQKRQDSDLKKLSKKIQKEGDSAQKKLRELSAQKFACTADAQKAAKLLLKNSKYHQLTDLEITENSGVYQVTATVTISEAQVEMEKRSAGRFVLATNVLNPEELTSDLMVLPNLLCKNTLSKP